MNNHWMLWVTLVLNIVALALNLNRRNYFVVALPAGMILVVIFELWSGYQEPVPMKDLGPCSELAKANGEFDLPARSQCSGSIIIQGQR